MAIELRLLRYFVAVAEEQHVGRAAARLYITQPALSQQIRALEAQVGVPLFVRHPRGVELTAAGDSLLVEARALLSRSDRLEAIVDDLRRGRASVLRVGVPPGVARDLVPPLMAGLRDAQADARVEIAELTTPEQLTALRDASLDLGFVREPVDDPQLSRSTLLTEPLGVSLPCGHPLAARSTVTLRELAGELFVCFPRTWAPSLHDMLISELHARGIEARFQESSHVATTAGMVAGGYGLTLSARPWLEGTAGIVWRALSDVEIEIRTAAAWRSDNPAPLLRTLVGLLPSTVVSGGGRGAAPSPVRAT